jgi:hypothetical protein
MPIPGPDSIPRQAWTAMMGASFLLASHVPFPAGEHRGQSPVVWSVIGGFAKSGGVIKRPRTSPSDARIAPKTRSMTHHLRRSHVRRSRRNGAFGYGKLEARAGALERYGSGGTTIGLAHRLATVTQAPRILVMNGGRIVQTGTHGPVMQDEGGLDAHLVTRQLQSDCLLWGMLV